MSLLLYPFSPRFFPQNLIDLYFAGKNPDALPPKTLIGRFFVGLGSVVRFLKSPEGIFSLRHACVSVALWVPAVVKSTAWFYYGNRGIWALIMAQVGFCLVYAEKDKN